MKMSTVVRVISALILLIGAYRETGLATTLCLFLIFVGTEKHWV